MAKYANSECDENCAKYLLAVKRTKRRCLEEAVSHLFLACGRRRSYDTLEKFCTEALSWRREDLLNLFSEAQINLCGVLAQSDEGSSVSGSPPSVFSQFNRFVFPRKDSPGLLVTTTNVQDSCFENVQLLKTSRNKRRHYSLPEMSLRSTRCHWKLHVSPSSQNNKGEPKTLSTDFKRNEPHPLSPTFYRKRAASDSSHFSKAKVKTSIAKTLSHQIKILSCPVKSPEETKTDIARDQRRESHCDNDDDDVEKQKTTLHIPDPRHCDLMSAEPDPSRLPEMVLVLLLTKVFPNIPSRIQYLLRRLTHLPYIICYPDLRFDDKQLTLRLADLESLTSDILSLVIQSCKEIIEVHLKEARAKLCTSKRKLRRTVKEYRSHKKWVNNTREKLVHAERELDRVKVQGTNAEMSIKSLCSQSNISQSDTEITNSGAVGRGYVLCRDLHSSDSGNVSLGDDFDSCSQTEGDVDSLFVDVMKEVAVIERKHSKAEADRKPQHTQNKREILSRKDSNVSVEQDSIMKETIYSERKFETNKLTKEVQKLRKDYEDLNDKQNLTLSKFMDSTFDEEAVTEGCQAVQDVREGNLGKLLKNARQKAIKYATNSKVLDVGEWLVWQRSVKQEIQHVYSKLTVNDSAESIELLDLLERQEQMPSVIVLSGSKGSGKSCMCRHVVHHWQSNQGSAKFRETDLVIYITISDVISSGSWSQYLRKYVFCATSQELTDSEIYEALDSLTALFLLDVGTLTSERQNILFDVLRNLGNNSLILTSRLECDKEIIQVVKEHDLACSHAKICPMSPESVKKYAFQVISLYGKTSVPIETQLMQFNKLLFSRKVADNLLFPIYIAYLVYLWQIDPGYVVRSFTVTKLFLQVLFLCEERMSEAMWKNSSGDKAIVRSSVKSKSYQLCQAAWKLISQGTRISDSSVVLKEDDNLMKDPLFIQCFGPLILVQECQDSHCKGTLVHHSLADILCGIFLAKNLLLKPKGWLSLRNRWKSENLCKEARNFKYAVPHMAGMLMCLKHSAEDAREAATLYFKCLLEEQDMSAWVNFMRECDFAPSMCAAVTKVLSIYSTWNVAQHPQAENCSVADLLRNNAYQPKLVTLAQHVKPTKCYHGTGCIVRALATCSSTLVHLHQEYQFYTWGETASSDDVAVSLQPPGTLEKCWGHLGVEGAQALRHSHHLQELHIRISSTDALTALSYSLGHLSRSLKYLQLRLDLPTDTPTSSIHPLNFKGKTLHLTVRGITDSSLDWAKNLCGRLSSWYTEIVLEESQLSSGALHAFKENFPETPVHICRV